MVETLTPPVKTRLSFVFLTSVSIVGALFASMSMVLPAVMALPAPSVMPVAPTTSASASWNEAETSSDGYTA